MLGVRHTSFFRSRAASSWDWRAPRFASSCCVRTARSARSRSRAPSRPANLLLARAAHDVAGGDLARMRQAGRLHQFLQRGQRSLVKAIVDTLGFVGHHQGLLASRILCGDPRGAVPGDHARDVERADDLASATEAHTVTQVQPDQGVVHQQQTFPQRRAQETQVAITGYLRSTEWRFCRVSRNPVRCRKSRPKPTSHRHRIQPKRTGFEGSPPRTSARRLSAPESGGRYGSADRAWLSPAAAGESTGRVEC